MATRSHKRIYFDYFGYSSGDWIACSVCGNTAVDIHAIDCDGMGGTKKEQPIEGLIAVCRPCHNFYGDKNQFKEYLYELQRMILNNGKLN